jgi:hypothetical protein
MEHCPATHSTVRRGYSLVSRVSLWLASLSAPAATVQDRPAVRIGRGLFVVGGTD